MLRTALFPRGDIYVRTLALARGRLFKSCGVGEASNWVAAHPDMKAFFDDQARISAGPENEIARLIDYRNDAAHGGQSVDDVVGLDTLKEFADFTFLLCQVMAERMQLEILKNAEKKQLVVRYGQITEIFRQGSIVIVPVVGEISVGQVVYLIGDTYCVRCTITSIQLNDVDRDNFTAMEATELGLGLDRRGKKGATIVAMRETEQQSAA